jgi:hypothetical protein
MASLLQQQDVDELLAEHRGQVEELRRRLGPIPARDAVGCEFDELWLLRYVLSNGGAAKSEAPARAALAWRAEHETLTRAARTGDLAAVPGVLRLKRHMSGCMHSKVTSLGGPVYLIRGCVQDAKALKTHLTVAGYDSLTEYLMFQREVAFSICDEGTRRTRKLVKMLTIHDMFNLQMDLDRAFLKAMGGASKLSESVYPQLLQAFVMLNAPGFVRGMMTVARPFFSKRMLEKCMFCKAKATADMPAGAVAGCPIATRLLPAVDIPTFCGGECNCPGGCVAGFSNAQRQPLPTVTDASGLRQLVVRGRGAEELVFDVAAGRQLELTVVVAERALSLSVAARRRGRPDEPLLAPRTLAAADGEVTATLPALSERADLVIRLDNAASGWRSAREVSLRVKRLPAVASPLEASESESDEDEEFYDALAHHEADGSPRHWTRGLELPAPTEEGAADLGVGVDPRTTALRALRMINADVGDEALALPPLLAVRKPKKAIGGGGGCCSSARR